MPIYDYVCGSCRHLIEVVHAINDPGPRFCPACGADGSMRKALSKPAIHFKGTGWAKKDRSSASTARSKSPKDGDGGAGDTAPKPAEGPAPGDGTAPAAGGAAAAGGEG